MTQQPKACNDDETRKVYDARCAEKEDHENNRRAQYLFPNDVIGNLSLIVCGRLSRVYVLPTRVYAQLHKRVTICSFAVMQHAPRVQLAYNNAQKFANIEYIEISPVVTFRRPRNLRRFTFINQLLLRTLLFSFFFFVSLQQNNYSSVQKEISKC